MNYTSIEQSKKLLELGLNRDTADMCYPKDAFAVNYDEEPVCNYSGFGLAHPCWSLGALLDVLKTRKDCNFITIHSSYSLKWILNTSYYELANWKEKETIGETPIEAAYNMVVWLLENEQLTKE